MQPCPPGREVIDFQFKLFSSVRVFPAVDFQNFFNNPSNTITASNKHGLLIVGTPTGFQIINLAQFISPNAVEFLNETPDYPCREYNINAQPCHIALNCDETLLSVAHQHTDNSPLVRIYKMASLTHQSKNKVVKITVGPPGTCITDFSWNPVVPELLSVCVSNGCLCLYSHDDTGKNLNMLPPEKQVTCVSWSPKGKQLLAGDKFGNIVQYKPDLKVPQKVVPPPKDLFPNQCSIVNVIWLSVYQYGVVYVNNQSMETHFSIVNAPKNAPVKYVSYDEICFNSGTVRPHQFYLMHLSAWNILIVSSSNSTEVSVLSLLDDKVTWEQWLQEDSTRLDLPIDKNNSETYPVGVTIATCSQLKIKWGENNFVEPMPTLSIVSNDGLVLLFHVINLTPNAAQLCSPFTPLPDHMFGSQANPLVQSSNANAQVSVVTSLPPNFNIPSTATSQGQSPVLEISTRNVASESPLSSLLSKPQISITPVSSQAPKISSASTLSLFPQSIQPSVQTQSVPSQKSDTSSFQAMTQSLFQSVVQSNSTPVIPQETQAKNPTTPIPPTIVKTSLEKQQLIVDQAPQVKKSSPKQRTGTIKKEDLELFISLEENINQLLKSYKINIGSTELDVNLSKINDQVDQLENFFSQLEDSTKSLANDVTSMKHALNEAFIYAHESKDQLAKYERKKNHNKDLMAGIMISKKSMNPIVEKKLMTIENEIRKSTYFVRSCIQESRPILQHLELVKSGKNLLNFQSILQSINKEKHMISRCSHMLDEINRDVSKMFIRHQIFRYPNGSSKDRTIENRKVVTTKPIDKFQSIKDQIKTKPKMSNEKLSKLKTLHMTQVLEPIRHSDLNQTNPERLRTSDLLKIFKSPPKKSQLTPQKSRDQSTSEQIVETSRTSKDESLSERILEKELVNKENTSVSTPVVSKTKATVPTALFGVESKPFAVPSPVICEKPEINKNTATFVIDTSNNKANATKLSFDDSLAAFGSNMTKNMFTSTPAVSSATKLPSFAAPTSLAPNFGATFTKVSETTNLPVTSKPTFQFSVPTTVPAFSENKTTKPAMSAPTSAFSGKPMFGGAATTSAGPLSFGTTTAPFSVSLPSSVPTSTFGTESKSLFPLAISTTTSTTSTFSFMPTSSSKLSFGSTFATTTASAPITSFSISSVPSFGTASTSTTTPVSTPAFTSTQTFSKPITTTPSTISFGAATSISFGASSSEDSKVNTKPNVSQPSVDPAVSSLPRFDFAAAAVSAKSPTSEKKTPELEKSNEKKLEEIASGEHPVSASSSNVSLGSLLSSTSSASKSVTSQESALSDVKPSASSSSISQPAESKPLTTTSTAPPAVSFGFGSSTSLFGGAPKTTSGFSFLSAASSSGTSSSSSSSASTVVATASSSTESIASTVSSVSSSSVFGGASSVPSIFGNTTVTTTASVFETPKKTSSVTPAATTPPNTPAPATPPSSDAVVPTTPTKPVSSESTVPETASVAASSSITPSTPTSSAAPFKAMVTPTTSAGFAPAVSPAAPLFGSAPPAEPTTTTADIGNLFGQNLSFGGATSPTTQASVFGQSGGNLFASSGGGFGQTGGSIFGKSTTPSSSNLFGQGGSVFGTQTPAASGNVFVKSGSVFGDTPKPTNAFGTPATSPFGQQTSSSAGSFGAASPFGGGFGSSAVKTESSPFFGQGAFGGNTPTSSTSVFGAPTTSSGSVFGQAASPFGFGQSNASQSFGSGNSSGFGAKSTFGQTGGSIFGGKSSFGTSGGSIFGGGASTGGGSVFGGSPSFGSSGGGAFGQAASFGQAAQPAFGSSAFGAAPSFGSNATFGGAPAFGNTSPSKIFGANEPASPQAAAPPSFGMAAAASGQLSFGNLAQQTPQTGFGSFGQAQPSAPAFGAQPTPGFSNPAPSGGSSFSSWR